MAFMPDEYNDIDSLLAGEPKTRPQIAAGALRKQPVTQSTSLPHNVQPVAEQPVNTRQEQSRRAMAGIEEGQQKLESLYGPQDYSGMQEYAKQRSEQGNRHLMLALAAQEAGDEFKPMSAVYLKRAMEARDPMKVAGGLVTPEGKYVEDAGFRTEQRIKQVQAQMARNEQIIASNATAEEKAQAHRDNLDLKREQMEATMEMRRMTAGMAAGNRNFQQEQKVFQGEDRMKGDFEQVTKPAREGWQAAQQVKPLLAGAVGRKTTNVEQQALITLFNKFLDPTSVVREGEFNRMAQGMGLGQRVQNWTDHILKGSIVTPQMVNEIARVSDIYEKDALRRIQQQSAEYETIARQRQYDPRSVITNPAWRTGGGAPSGPPEGAVRPSAAPQPAAPAASYPQGAVRVAGH